MLQTTMFDDIDLLPSADASLEELMERYDVIQGAQGDPVTLIRRQPAHATPEWI
jgi:hypothetical protein